MPRSSRLVVALLAVALLVLGGCTLPVVAPTSGSGPGSAASGGASAPAGSLSWRSCPEVPRRLVGRAASGMAYDCATVHVPQDWATPSNGQTYGIALVRIRSQKQHDRIGSLLLNPGGPGGSGIDTAVYLSFGQALGGLPTEITDRFDVIGFDPRGVGESDPIKCISDKDQDATFAADPDPASRSEFDSVVALNKRIVQGCESKFGARLATFSTKQAARDMDSIRAAVGDPKMTYLGFSYGTLLGATYAQLYPKNVRALVLDGAVDPKQDYITSSEVQAKGFERAFTNFSNWCKGDPSSCKIAPDPRGALLDAMAKAEHAPVRGEDGREATPGWIFIAVISSLYTETGWQQLAGAVDALQRGEAKGILDLADQYAERGPDGHYSNLFDANLAVNCTDATNTPSVDKIRQLQSRWRAKYPLFGAPLAIGMLPCAFWPGKRDPYPVGAAVGAPPILVVGTTGDPATPYENTAQLAGMLGSGHVLTWKGEGHTAYPSTSCIVSAVDAYLLRLTVPPAGESCPAR